MGPAYCRVVEQGSRFCPTNADFEGYITTMSGSACPTAISIAATYNYFRALCLYIPLVHAYYINRLHHTLTVLSLAKCTVDYNYLPPRCTSDNTLSSLQLPAVPLASSYTVLPGSAHPTVSSIATTYSCFHAFYLHPPCACILSTGYTSGMLGMVGRA